MYSLAKTKANEFERVKWEEENAELKQISMLHATNMHALCHLSDVTAYKLCKNMYALAQKIFSNRQYYISHQQHDDVPAVAQVLVEAFEQAVAFYYFDEIL